MIPRGVFAAVSLAVVLSSSPRMLAASATAAPCASVSFGHDLDSASFAGVALRLLNGTENPRLQRLLARRLESAAKAAVGWLDKGTPLPDAPHPNLTELFRRAEEYATTHLKGETPGRLKRLYSALHEHDLAYSKSIK